MKYLFKIFTTFLLFQSTALYSQSMYSHFPDSNAHWNVHIISWGHGSCPPPPSVHLLVNEEFISYFIEGDTTYNGNKYNKLFRSGWAREHCLYSNFIDFTYPLQKTYFGAIREDTLVKKVYYLESFSSTECLLYDFSMNIGDTLKRNCLNSSSCAIVTSIDTFSTAPIIRRRLNFSNFYSIIEGIGSTSGLLEPLCPFESSGTLSCVWINDSVVFSDTSTVCNLLTQIMESKTESTLRVYPNPAMDYINISSHARNYNISIYNTFGNKVLETEINSETSIINIESLSSGVYFLRINNPGKILTSKFMKVR